MADLSQRSKGNIAPEEEGTTVEQAWEGLRQLCREQGMNEEEVEQAVLKFNVDTDAGAQACIEGGFVLPAPATGQ